MKRGFTLAELLIALAILGVISTFTIPKVLQSQSDGKFNAIAKEAISMTSGAYSAYQLKNTPTSATKAPDLTPYMNYVNVDTTSIIDQVYNVGSTINCSNAAFLCLRLHNGAMLQMMNSNSFGGTANTNAVWFKLDPDGKVTDGTATGPGHSLHFFLYTTGRIANFGSIAPGTTDSSGTYTAIPNQDPPWFSWN